LISEWVSMGYQYIPTGIYSNSSLVGKNNYENEETLRITKQFVIAEDTKYEHFR
jgi:hypothetical protein